MRGAGPVAGAAELFADRFGADPEGVWYAPGRVNLIGEHTDYNGGFALPFAISAGVCVAAGQRPGGELALVSRQGGGTVVPVPLAGLAPGSVPGWAAYPAGAAWALLAAGHELAGANLAVDADLALGAGLSSSAALECAALLALTDLSGLPLARTELAAAGTRAENEFVGVPTGVMDQMVVLLARPAHALLLDCRAVAATHVPFDVAAAGFCVLVIDTRARHQLTDGGYASRRGACADAARALGVRSLREVRDIDELHRLGDALLRRRARHVVTENLRVLEATDLLLEQECAAVGPLLTASHASLRDDFEVSWPEADVAVAMACEAGAVGARMTGGGFGGSVIALIPTVMADMVADAVSAAFAQRNWQLPRIWRAAPAEGARRLH
jgi:galactokinase